MIGWCAHNHYHVFAGSAHGSIIGAMMCQALFPQMDAAALDRCASRFTVLFSQSIYKWVQSPLSLHVGSLDLDRERALQMPVVQKNEWH